MWSIKERGLGLLDLFTHSLACLSKHIWSITLKDKLYIRWINWKCLAKDSIWCFWIPSSYSFEWSIFNLSSLILCQVKYLIGMTMVHWLDPWLYGEIIFLGHSVRNKFLINAHWWLSLLKRMVGIKDSYLVITFWVFEMELLICLFFWLDEKDVVVWIPHKNDSFFWMLMKFCRMGIDLLLHGGA